MKRQLLGLLIVWYSSGALAFAQALPDEAPKTGSAVEAAKAKDDSCPIDGDSACPKTSCDPCAPAPACGCFWVSADYLLWWLKDGPLPTPLVTSGTSTLFGSSDQSYGAESGVQLSAGVYDPIGLGLEGGIFVLERKGTGFNAASDAAGNPPLALPFSNAVTGAPGQLLVSSPGAFAGNLVASSSSRFWGAEVDLAHSLSPSPRFGFDMLAGFRFLHLEERVSLNAASIDLPAGMGTLNGVALPAATPVTLADSFGTQNGFYGGQLGCRAEYRFNRRFYVDLMGKVAIGLSHEAVSADGASSAALPGGTVIVPGGLFANGDVIGRKTQDEFAVVPEGSITFGYQPARRVRAYVGYNFIYWSSVVRPGDQISSAINPAVVPLLPGSGAVPAAGGPTSRETDLWAHGVTFGLAFHY